MTVIYTTREGAKWVVQDCRPHFQCPDFQVGTRQLDGKKVAVHRHRYEVVEAEFVMAMEPKAQEGNAA